MKFIRFGIFTLGLAMAGAALADDPVSMGTFDDWESFTYQDQGKPVC